MADAFDRFQGKDSEKGDAFDKFPIEEESWGKSALRTVAQIPQGLAEGTKAGIAANLFQLLATGESDLSVEDFHKLREISEQNGQPFDEESYEDARRQMLSYIPTVSNIASAVEEKTDLPLEPKTKFQKGLRYASSLGKALPKAGSAAAPSGLTVRGSNTALPRPLLGAAGATAREGLIQTGVPEFLADIAAPAVLKVPTSGKQLEFTSKKPSGMTDLQYEKLKNPREVSQKTLDKIKTKHEGEFKAITDKIISESPIGETVANLKENVAFKKETAKGFDRITELANQIPDTHSTKDLTSLITKKLKARESSAISPSEFDKSHNKFVNQYIKDIGEKEITNSNLVKQYRKNNKELGEAYEPGQSFAYNRAKREALSDYNSAIADLIEAKNPGGELPKFFKEQNKIWSQIMDAEAIDHFLEDLFKGKIRYDKGRKFFNKQGASVPFERALGKEGFAKFETVMKDLLSTEEASKLLKAAQTKGVGDIAKTALTYAVHPTAGAAKLGWDLMKNGYNAIFETALDKPQLMVNWDRGINALKKGEFKVAQKELAPVEKAVKALDAKEISRRDQLKKAKERKVENTLKETTPPIEKTGGDKKLKIKKKTDVEILEEQLGKTFDKIRAHEERYLNMAHSKKEPGKAWYDTHHKIKNELHQRHESVLNELMKAEELEKYLKNSQKEINKLRKGS